MSQGVQQEALTRLLEEKGIFSKEEFLEKVKRVNEEMKRKEGRKMNKDYPETKGDYPEPKRGKLSEDESEEIRREICVLIERGDYDNRTFARKFGCSRSQIAGFKGGVKRSGKIK